VSGGATQWARGPQWVQSSAAHVPGRAQGMWGAGVRCQAALQGARAAAPSALAPTTSRNMAAAAAPTMSCLCAAVAELNQPLKMLVAGCWSTVSSQLREGGRRRRCQRTGQRRRAAGGASWWPQAGRRPPAHCRSGRALPLLPAPLEARGPAALAAQRSSAGAARARLQPGAAQRPVRFAHTRPFLASVNTIPPWYLITRSPQRMPAAGGRSALGALQAHTPRPPPPPPAPRPGRAVLGQHGGRGAAAARTFEVEGGQLVGDV
jgi:hypothetical protein